MVELVALIGFLVCWELTLADRPHGTRLSLLMVLAFALGVQSSAIQRFGVPGLSSTYLTGTLTTLIGGVAARRPARSLLPSVRVLLSLMCGALVGALVARHVPWGSPILLVVPLAAVMALSRLLDRSGSATAGGIDERSDTKPADVS
jgi:uncharacterized membrane protein YoaK (UPF0700 family)